MEATKNLENISKTKMDKHVNILLYLMWGIATWLIAMALISCSKDEPQQDPNLPQGTGTVKGTVKDEQGNPYPSALVKIINGSDQLERATNAEGFYEKKTDGIGTYEVTLVPPLSTEVVSANPASANVQANQSATVDFVIKPKIVEAHLNFGKVQLLEEIVDKDGNTPTDPNEPLFAKNIFDAPVGQLNEIKAPDGHQVSLSEFQTAKGNLLVHCNGNSSTVEISLEGMIPNGTYTFWLAYLNKTRKVGESIDFANDFVNFTNPPIGPSNGSGNALVADANGKIEATLEHTSCILTDEVALVIPVLYHLNGKTFGGGHVPDAEETVQMLVYFQ
ncbi:carboxypeptidase-like regulatory domain-containing protein [Pricia sp.]|uniref:carboxypeptidase-like regulatory domain-containing protein n=1 Tax=Pricia sp. TaxID=2268138 RepID=UPI00359388FD